MPDWFETELKIDNCKWAYIFDFVSAASNSISNKHLDESWIFWMFGASKKKMRKQKQERRRERERKKMTYINFKCNLRIEKLFTFIFCRRD